MNNQPDILSKLADDARRNRVARMLPAEGPLTDEQIRLVAEDFADFLTNTGKTIAQVSRSLGAGYTQSVLSQFKGFAEDGRTKYAGDASGVARALNGYMETHAQRTEAWRPDGFIMTGVAKNIITVVQKAVTLQTIAVISGDAGRGKTMAMLACHKNHAGSVYVRIRRDRRTSTALARALVGELKIKGASTGPRMIEAVIGKLTGTGRPLFIDEAHQMQPEALELVRDIHDECGVPVILAGTYDINDKTADRDIFYGQFSSRIALRYDINERARGKGGGGDRNSRMTKPIHTVEEILALFTEDKVRLTDSAVDFLFKLANVEGLGGIRLPKQVMMLAVPVAKGQPVSAKLLRAVLAEMHGHARFTRQIDLAVQTLEVKSA